MKNRFMQKLRNSIYNDDTKSDTFFIVIIFVICCAVFIPIFLNSFFSMPVEEEYINIEKIVNKHKEDINTSLGLQRNFSIYDIEEGYHLSCSFNDNVITIVSNKVDLHGPCLEYKIKKIDNEYIISDDFVKFDNYYVVRIIGIILYAIWFSLVGDFFISFIVAIVYEFVFKNNKKSKYITA